MHEVEQWVCEQINHAGLQWREANRLGDEADKDWHDARMDAWGEVLARFGQTDAQVSERIDLAKGTKDD